MIGAASSFNLLLNRSFVASSGQLSTMLTRGSALRAINNTAEAGEARRNAIAQIKAELANLRKLVLAEWQNQKGTSPGQSDLRPVYKSIEQTIKRAIYTTQNVYETRAIYETRDVYATRDVYGTRDIYETQPVYENREIRETTVTGSRVLTGYSSLLSAGILTGSKFSIQVGSAQQATIEFRPGSKIELNIGGQKTTFSFSANDGSWRSALLNAMNTVPDLSASITSSGYLQLQTADAQSLTVNTVSGSTNPLSGLGLTAGTTQSSVVRIDEVQIGTEDVVVGQEQYVIGQEQYVVAQEQVQIGTEEVKIGTEQVQTGVNEVSLGKRPVLVGFDRANNSPVNESTISAIRNSIQRLTSEFGTLRSVAGDAGRDANALANSVESLLRNSDFRSLLGAPDSSAYVSVVAKLDQALARAGNLGSQFEVRPDYHLSKTDANVSTMLMAGIQPLGGDFANSGMAAAEYLRVFSVGNTRHHSMFLAT